MATVRLGLYEVEDYDLPRVCMRCGARAVAYKERRFRWFPRWLIVMFPLGMLPYFIITEVMTKRMAVRVPCCDQHKKRPLWPTLVNVGTLAALIAVAVALMLIFNDGGMTGFICATGLLAFVFWCFAALIISTPAIRPTEITEKSITLKGVCEEFIEALEAERRGDDKGCVRDDQPRRQRRREDGGGSFEPGEKRRRPPPDAYEAGDDHD